eukprot:3351885-Rhodomonas_salina.3
MKGVTVRKSERACKRKRGTGEERRGYGEKQESVSKKGRTGWRGRSWNSAPVPFASHSWNRVLTFLTFKSSSSS